MPRKKSDNSRLGVHQRFFSAESDAPSLDLHALKASTQPCIFPTQPVLPHQQSSRAPSTQHQFPCAVPAHQLQDALPRDCPTMAHSIHSPSPSAPCNCIYYPSLGDLPINPITDKNNLKIYHRSAKSLQTFQTAEVKTRQRVGNSNRNPSSSSRCPSRNTHTQDL